MKREQKRGFVTPPNEKYICFLGKVTKAVDEFTNFAIMW
jgi:hypothetical protein